MEPSPVSESSQATFDVGAEPDVWWGPNGIDALVWGDPISYRRPIPEKAIEIREPVPVSDTA